MLEKEQNIILLHSSHKYWDFEFHKPALFFGRSNNVKTHISSSWHAFGDGFQIYIKFRYSAKFTSTVWEIDCQGLQFFLCH
jgi:hypothetical protein